MGILLIFTNVREINPFKHACNAHWYIRLLATPHFVTSVIRRIFCMIVVVLHLPKHFIASQLPAMP